MFSKKYTPKNLQDLKYNNHLIPIIKRLAKYPSNIIFNGFAGSGKKTLAYCFLAELYGDNVYNTQIESTLINKTLTFEYITSNYHIDINPSNYGMNDKYIISELIEDYTTTRNIITNKWVSILIRNADKLSDSAMMVLKKIIEKNTNTIFIILSSSFSKIDSTILNSSIKIRVPNPSYSNIIKCLSDIAKSENIKYNCEELEDIINTSMKWSSIPHISDCMNIMQISYISGKYVKFVVNQHIKIEEMIKLINIHKYNVNNILQFRSILYSLYIYNINIIELFKYTITYFCINVNHPVLYKLIENAAKYDVLMSSGNKLPMFYEAFMWANMYELLNNNYLIDIYHIIPSTSDIKINTDNPPSTKTDKTDIPHMSNNAVLSVIMPQLPKLQTENTEPEKKKGRPKKNK